MSLDSNFRARYNALNLAQKKAVDTIEGPVMVVAGPGTGKTELLAVRVANILRRTDTLAENILCLTFTDSGASAMRTRLAGLMGKDAYKVNVTTFHGLGSEIITEQSDYFYSGAEFRASDELSTHQILIAIFSRLKHDDPLAKNLNGNFTQLRQTQATISDFKRAGLNPDEVQRLVRSGEAFVDYASAAVRDFFANPISKVMIKSAPALLKKLQSYKAEPLGIATFTSLSQLCASSLAAALEEADSSGKTSDITAWRNNWLEKNIKNQFVFKDIKRHKNLLAASHVYSNYLAAMREAQLYDYDDMILRVVHALEVFPDMRYNLQERYQYILCDEFQDTNGAQMRILHSLTSGAVEAKPNIMVVGDDDQAIYRFQGAEINNILAFRSWMHQPTIITLNENYRSSGSILQAAREVITLGSERLETSMSEVDKRLRANKKDAPELVGLIECATSVDEYTHLADTLKRHTSTPSSQTIAVLARNHKEILALVPYLESAKVPFSYERRDSVFDDESVKLLLDLAAVVDLIATGAHQQSDVAMPPVLAHPAWGLPPKALWNISLLSYKNQQTWLETMLNQPEDSLENKLAGWLVSQAKSCAHLPLEYMLDTLFGSTRPDTSFVSPLKQYFFSNRALQENSDHYIRHLQALASLRHSVREHRPTSALLLRDLVKYVDLSKAAALKLENHYQAEINKNEVALMTVHRAKGLEFDKVFVIGAAQTTWGSSARVRANRLYYPANIVIGPSGDSYDDHLRLFYVAMTRAKNQLSISYAAKNTSGREVLRADFLSHWQPRIIKPSHQPQAEVRAAELEWYGPLLPSVSPSQTESLESILKEYVLSVTHLNNFIDVTRGGPQSFLLGSLLHFPQAISPSAALGSAIHKTLQRAGAHLSATKQLRPLEDLLYDFDSNLKACRLSPDDFTRQLQRGSQALSVFLGATYGNFDPNTMWEVNFKHQAVTLEEVRLTGIIDVISQDTANKTLSVHDYKTGKPSHSWQAKTDNEKIKLHKYRQQLLFYKLLIEHSRRFYSYTVTKGELRFVEPDEHGQIISLDMAYDSEELEKFKELLRAVWRRILAADFVDTSSYPQSYKGIVAFESDLLNS